MQTVTFNFIDSIPQRKSFNNSQTIHGSCFFVGPEKSEVLKRVPQTVHLRQSVPIV